MNEATDAMAEGRQNVRLMAEAAVEIRKLEKRVFALVGAVTAAEEAIRNSPHAKEFVQTSIMLIAARDDDRMGWSAR